MAILNKSQTKISEKDYWRTSPELINDALNLLNIKYFDMDVCCSTCETGIKQAKSWITEDYNSLLQEWDFEYEDKSNVVFCNPPFTHKWAFFQKAVEQSKKWSKQVLMVMPYNPCSKSWHENVHGTDCIIYVPDGRYQYLLPDGSKPKNTCNFETCLILIVPFKCGNVIVNYKRGLDAS